jgi:hypothetical protein
MRERLPVRILRTGVKRFARWILRVTGPADPWEKTQTRIPARRFGVGSRHEFAWYFEGESAVTAGTLDEVCEWLLGCTYQADPELFHEADFWQHPRTFEKLRLGDCEDHALWAWRKLVELGFAAELVSGTWRGNEGARSGHVWVRFANQGVDYILESIAKSRAEMVRTLAEAHADYTPTLGVDQSLATYVYDGALYSAAGVKPLPE